MSVKPLFIFLSFLFIFPSKKIVAKKKTICQYYSFLRRKELKCEKLLSIKVTPPKTLRFRRCTKDKQPKKEL